MLANGANLARTDTMPRLKGKTSAKELVVIHQQPNHKDAKLETC